MIAGHTLIETSRGRACAGCQRRWVDIRSATLADVGQPGFAHVDPVNEREIREIMAEREREDAVIAEATRVAAGLGIGGMAAGGGGDG